MDNHAPSAEQEAARVELMKLYVAEHPAPIVLGPAAARPVKTDGGRVVTMGDVVRGLVKKHEIEAEVRPGVRPKFVFCAKCKKRVTVPPTGQVPKFCGNACRDEQKRRKRYPCPGFGKSHGKCRGTFGVWSTRKLCRSCANAEATDSMAPSQRSDRIRKGHKVRNEESPERRKSQTANASKASAALPAHVRSESARKGHATRRAKRNPGGSAPPAADAAE